MAIEYKNTIRRPTLEELLLIEYMGRTYHGRKDGTNCDRDESWSPAKEYS